MGLKVSYTFTDDATGEILYVASDEKVVKALGGAYDRLFQYNKNVDRLNRARLEVADQAKQLGKRESELRETLPSVATFTIGADGRGAIEFVSADGNQNGGHDAATSDGESAHGATRRESATASK